MEFINNYLKKCNPDASGYIADNTTGILLQTHNSKIFGKNKRSEGNVVGTILIISNHLGNGLETMKSWAETLKSVAEKNKNAKEFGNVEWLIHLHLNSPLMTDWNKEIKSDQEALLQYLDGFGRSEAKIRFAIDCSAWLINIKKTVPGEIEKSDTVPDELSVFKEKLKNKLSKRKDRLKTIPYGLLRTFGLHQALVLNDPCNINDIYMIVDVEPSGNMSESKGNIDNNRKTCFKNTWEKLWNMKEKKGVAYNQLRWLPHDIATMVYEWYDVTYPESIPALLTKKEVRDEVKNKLSEALNDCMNKLTEFLNAEYVKSPYPSEPLLGFFMDKYKCPVVIEKTKPAINISKVAATVSSELDKSNVTNVTYVIVSNIMGVGSGEGRSLESSLAGGNIEKITPGIYTSAWGVLKDIVCSKLKLVVSSDGKSYSLQGKITVEDLRDMGGVFLNAGDAGKIIWEIPAPK
ncbi:hypothetical protein [Dickeya lacustris]|uniref:Uncharacterized protein n=1 Tax=Dickeya lacustris TaxID=2259638 RepID=A0ABY8G7J2_9GAMM|nr:hypothetical protein [Dickeya lacustris]WFN55939.1 hypothetical protein O1Q98_00985 [Dickeya lacustris]